MGVGDVMPDRFESTPEIDALYAFDAANDVQPCRKIAEDIAAEYGFFHNHPIVDDIAHAVEDARDIGERRARSKPATQEKLEL